jgi:hypothetical protein
LGDIEISETVFLSINNKCKWLLYYIRYTEVESKGVFCFYFFGIIESRNVISLLEISRESFALKYSKAIKELLRYLEDAIKSGGTLVWN